MPRAGGCVSSTKALAISLLLGAISVIIGLAGGIVWVVSPERGQFAAAVADDAATGGPLEMQAGP